MRRLFFVSLLSLTALSATGPGRAQEQPASPTRTIDVTAKKFEFEPPTINVKVGETVQLNLNSMDAKHGFESKDLRIKKVVFEPGKPAQVTFTPAKAGTFDFHCANYCGKGHGGMKGQIVVSQ
jgi:cytochrome c oxidase subunit 2